jgi:3'(2'), 5'-bisphosphate nucleotidase
MAIKTSNRDLLFDLAQKAGEACMKYYRHDFNINYKSDESPVTLADIEANQIIISGLAKTGIPVISEESENLCYDERKYLVEFWIVDPLDGTKQFVNGEDEFTVNIALIRNNQTVEGVVYAPAKSILYYGLVGIGAEKLDLDTGINTKLICENQSDYKLNVVASKSHLNAKTMRFLAILMDKFGDVNTVNSGSSLKFCAVAEGSANVYPRIGPINEWDIAAGHAVLKAAGGNVISLITGDEVSYNGETLKTPDYIALRDDFYLDKFLNFYHKIK